MNSFRHFLRFVHMLSLIFTLKSQYSTVSVQYNNGDISLTVMVSFYYGHLVQYNYNLNIYNVYINH